MAKCIYEIRTPFFGLENAGNPRKYGGSGGCIFFVQLFWQGQKDLNPRHAVLEAMLNFLSRSDFSPILGICCQPRRW